MVPCPDCKDAPEFWTCVTCDGTKQIDPLADLATIRSTVCSTLLSLLCIFHNCERMGIESMSSSDLAKMMALFLDDLGGKTADTWGGTYQIVREALAKCPQAADMDLRMSQDFIAGLYAGAALLSTKADGEGPDSPLTKRLQARAANIRVTRSAAKNVSEWMDDLIKFVYEGGDAS